MITVDGHHSDDGQDNDNNNQDEDDNGNEHFHQSHLHLNHNLIKWLKQAIRQDDNYNKKMSFFSNCFYIHWLTTMIVFNQM